MNHDLETTLSAYRHLRNIGNLLILIGILAEIAIDILWPERSTLFPTLREYKAVTPCMRWWNHVYSCRVLAIFAAGLVVLGGLMLERVEGENADQVADQIRMNLQVQSTAVMYIMSSTRTPQLLPTSEFEALREFKGTKAFIDVVMSIGNERDTDFVDFDGSLAEALSRQLGWDVRPWLYAKQGTDVPHIWENITIISKGSMLFGPLPSSHPKPKAAIVRSYNAAEALTQYLNSVGLAARHVFIGAPRSLESDETLIVVGPRSKTLDPKLLANLEASLKEVAVK